jgi:hypothetical protein
MPGPLIQQLRRALEQAVIDVKGEVSLTQAADKGQSGQKIEDIRTNVSAQNF